MFRRVNAYVLTAAVALAVGGALVAQEGGLGSGAQVIRTLPFGSDVYVPLPAAPVVYQTSDHKIRVVTLVDGLSRPWSLAFLPGGEILVTERTGQLRIIRKGVLDPEPIRGMPDVVSLARDGLMDIALHPNFAQNRFLYFTYTKPGVGKAVDMSADCTSSPLRTCVSAAFASRTPQAIALARGRFNGKALEDVRDLFIADRWAPAPTIGSRIVFGKDGTLYMSIAGAADDWMKSQKADNDQGKVLRLKDDGTVPADNPFAGKAGHKPEIFTLGHRNILGLAIHPETGALWSSEMGPQGGDEIDILLPGRNYGWPLVSMGRDYSGTPFRSEGSTAEFEPPQVFWAPAIGISGLTFYRGDKFPKWKDSVFVGGLALPHVARVVFNEKGQHIRREWLLLDLKQRIRDVREGPDGYLYVLTDAAKQGALLRIEPAE
jgi:aldose sugar dehydrogenase